MKVAVTGGAGYIGSALVEYLIKKGEDIISLDNLLSGDYRQLKSIGADENARLEVVDIRDGNLLERNLEEVDAIVHLAAVSDVMSCRARPEEAISINIFGTHQVLNVAQKLGVPRVVFSSSAAVYGEPMVIPVPEDHPLRPLNLYGVTKLAGEKLMEAYHENFGISTITLRLGNVFGVGLSTGYEAVIPKFVKMGLAEQDLTIYGDGTSSRDYVHINDIVSAIYLSLKAKNIGYGVYNIGGETMRIDALSHNIVTALEKVAGRKVGIIHLRPRPGETEDFSYDYHKIERELGYKPRWSIKRGIEQIVKYRLKEIEVGS